MHTINVARLVAGYLALVLLALALLILYIGHPFDAGAVMTAASIVAAAWHHLHLECAAGRRGEA